MRFQLLSLCFVLAINSVFASERHLSMILPSVTLASIYSEYQSRVRWASVELDSTHSTIQFEVIANPICSGNHGCGNSVTMVIHAVLPLTAQVTDSCGGIITTGTDQLNTQGKREIRVIDNRKSSCQAHHAIEVVYTEVLVESDNSDSMDAAFITRAWSDSRLEQ